MIIQEIFEWSKGLALWQRDAIARLLIKHTVTSNDLDDLFALLKTAHGIPDPKGRISKPLSADQIPVPTMTSTHIELIAMKNLQHVNAIAENQRLPFSKLGMTVIYGDNGSGKSGYSRVLKRACRARDQMEEIHPNANLPNAKGVVAEADFEISVDGVEKIVHWINGEEAPPELSSLAIFDSRCARAYLDNEDDFSYVPYGLDIFEELASICRQLKALADAEYRQFTVDLTVFESLQGDTPVGNLIKTLSAKTSISQIEVLATLDQKELARYAEIDKSLKESNPKEKANELRRLASRIVALGENVTSKSSLVNHTVIYKLQSLIESFNKAKTVAFVAAQKFKEGETLLPGTGSAIWRELFDAARKFALESHPDKTFPNLGEDALCPLCQEPLGKGADRLLRFESFIQEETEKTVRSCRDALDKEYKLFDGQVIRLNFDDITYGEIESIDSQLAIDVRAFEIYLINRHNAIKMAVKNNKWDKIITRLINPAKRLQFLADKLKGEAETLEKAADENVRATLQKQFNDLDARIKLSRIKGNVVMAVRKLNYQAKLTQCLCELKTNAISLKASELTEKVVSKELADALNREFIKLGVGKLHVSLQTRSDRGKALHKLKLELPQSCTPVDILSEGEQSAIAIGSFLAEVGLGGGKGGIIFDDPVSSLDHLRRERVARRLVDEARQRQVIIFTHDIYFLCILIEAAKLDSVSIATQSLKRGRDGFGIADSDLPFEGKNTGERIGELKANHQSISKLFKDGDEQEYRKQIIEAYSRLRMAWERAVEEVLFRKVVLRFRKGVETQKLREVLVEDSDYNQVNAGMTQCSNYTHDRAELGGVAVPDPDELLVDIMALENWRVQIESRSEKVAKKRKENKRAGLEPAPTKTVIIK